jgi:hypothetical protein
VERLAPEDDLRRGHRFVASPVILLNKLIPF